MSKPQGNTSGTAPGWMMVIACLLMAAIISGVMDTPTSGSQPIGNFVAE